MAKWLRSLCCSRDLHISANVCVIPGILSMTEELSKADFFIVSLTAPILEELKTFFFKS